MSLDIPIFTFVYERAVMASGRTSSRVRKRMRLTLDVTFPSEESKEAFLVRLGKVRDAMTPAGAAKLDNYSLLSGLFSLAENQPSTTQCHSGELSHPPLGSTTMLQSAGECIELLD